MTTRTNLYALTALNLVVLALGLVQQLRPVFAESELPVLRARALEILDSQGRVRASIGVLSPDSASADEHSETVLFLLITERGRPTDSQHGSAGRSGRLPHSFQEPS